MRRFYLVRKVLLAAAVAIGGFSMMPRAFADDPANDPAANSPSMSSQSLKTETGTIEKIDKSSRKLTLRDDQGKTFDLKLSPDIKSFDQLKVGQHVTASFYEEIAVSIRQPGEAAPKMTEKEKVSGGMKMKQISVTAKITNVNPDENTLTIQDPAGKTHELKVNDPQVQARLKSLKAGDMVDLTYTEASAVSVQPAP
jgi:Cu/Ag efflux protein CusF